MLKGERLQRKEKAQRSFEPLKNIIIEDPVLAPPNFDLAFEVHCCWKNLEKIK